MPRALAWTGICLIVVSASLLQFAGCADEEENSATVVRTEDDSNAFAPSPWEADLVYLDYENELKLQYSGSPSAHVTVELCDRGFAEDGILDVGVEEDGCAHDVRYSEDLHSCTDCDNMIEVVLEGLIDSVHQWSAASGSIEIAGDSVVVEAAMEPWNISWIDNTAEGDFTLHAEIDLPDKSVAD